MRRTTNNLGERLESAAVRYRRTHISCRGWPQIGPKVVGLLGVARTSSLEAAVSSSDRSRRSRLEAALFLAREPLSPRKLAQLANLADGTQARTLLEQLRRRYDERGCAFQVVQVAGGYQLMTRPEFVPWLRPFAPQRQQIDLSGPALDTLAVVAYRQPVLRAEVEAIRGVQCGEILRQLMDRDLLRIAGRSQELGRPLLYGTTRRFLEAFGLRNLDGLPRAGQLRRQPIEESSANGPLGDSSSNLVPQGRPSVE